MNRISLAIAIFLLSIKCQSIDAAQLNVESVISPKSKLENPIKIKVSSDDVVFSEPSGNSRTYRSKDEDELFGDGTIEFDTSLPQGYIASDPILIRLPVQRPLPILVVLTGMKISDTNTRAREIYSINVGKGSNLSTEELFKLYQEAGYMSIRRLDDIEAPRPPERVLFNYDAQIFFKFLEISRELGRRNFMKISPSAERVKEYLSNQLHVEASQQTLKDGLRGNYANIKTLIDEIDFVDADQLSQVWNYLLADAPSLSVRKCKLMRVFVTKVQSFDDRKVEQWGESDNYKFLNIAYDGLKGCPAILRDDIAKNGSKSSVEELQKIEKIVNEIPEKPYATDIIKQSADTIKSYMSTMPKSL